MSPKILSYGTDGVAVIRDATPEDFPEIVPTSEDVNVERDRRVVNGTTINVLGYGPIRTEGREVDTRNLQGLVTGAQLRLSMGDTTTLTAFRDADNVIHSLTPMQLIALWQGGADFISGCFQAAWALKDNPDGIPTNFRNDEFWP